MTDEQSKPSFLKSLDSALLRAFDRIFPQNLRVRYVLGLTIVGVLTIVGHILIQASLIKLSSDEKTIRILESQIDTSESFYHEVVRLQTISNEKVFKRQLETLDKDILNLIEGHKDIMVRMNSESFFGLGFPKKLDPYKKNTATAFDQLSNVFGLLGNIKYLEDPELRLSDHTIISFIKTENHYRGTLEELVHNYEAESTMAVENFKMLEVALMLITLLILVLEGLYVFRPAVSRVYSAIQSRTDFLSRLSHEIRNPMNSILGMTQLLSKTRPNTQQVNYIKILENSGLGLLEMLNNLLDYSALESSKLKLENIKTDLYNVIEKSLDLVTTKIQEKTLAFTLDISNDVPLKILSDPIRLRQVIVNLLSNAVKFTESGFITLKVRLVSTTTERKIKFFVQDSGVGIDSSMIETIFESFVQENSSVRRKYGGTGLGLTIAKEIVQQMGGEMTLETKKGAGSTFSFTIPLIVDEKIKTINDYIPIRLDNLKFLIIDKQDKPSEYMESLIVDQGGSVDRIKSVASFDSVYQTFQKESYDIILLDAPTMGTNLEAFFIYLKEKKYDMDKVCILFRYIHANYLFDLLNIYKINNFFPKPIKPIEFVNYLSGYTPEPGIELETDETTLISDKKYKVLIAEDSADNRMLLQIYLEKYPLSLFFAENGKKAIELFNQQKFDIIFMDIQMPEMDGISATKAIRDIEKIEKLQAVPILAFSAHKPEEIFSSDEGSLFTDFVIKPINSNIVRAKLKQYLKFNESKKVEKEQTPVVTKKADEFDVTDLIPAYLDRRSKEVEQMKQYLEESDIKNLGRIGHQLKGSAKSYGFEELGQLGSELEKLSQLENNFDQIKVIVSKITDKIGEYRKTYLN